MLGGGYTILTMNDWFILFIFIFTVTTYKIFKDEISVYRKLKTLNPKSDAIKIDVDNAIADQRKRLKKLTIFVIVVFMAGVTLFRIFG